MPVLDGKGLSWFTRLLKKYIGIPRSVSGDMNNTLVLMGDDLDNYTMIGNYYCNPDNDAATVNNNPSGGSFILIVYSGAGYSNDTSNGDYLTQHLEDLYGNIWIRYKSTGSWSAWSKMVTIDESGVVGSGINPVYLNDGNLVASNSTVGSDSNFVYLNSGEITASDSIVGNNNQPIYLDNGTFTGLSSTIGSDTNPIYLSDGKLTASNSTVGGSDMPVYLKDGIFTACNVLNGISSYKLSNPGYVKYNCGLIIQWGTSNSTTVTFPLTFSSSTSYVIMKNPGSSSSYKISHDEVSYYSRKAASAKTVNYSNYSTQWIAIGY